MLHPKLLFYSRCYKSKENLKIYVSGEISYIWTYSDSGSETGSLDTMMKVPNGSTPCTTF